MLIGWANYFCLGPVSKAYRAVERHTCRGCASGCAPNTKCRVREPTVPDDVLHGSLVWSGSTADRQPSVGDTVSLLREPDAGNPHVRFDEREQTEPSQTGLRRPSESLATMPPGDYSHCACSRLYRLRLCQEDAKASCCTKDGG